MRAYGISTRLFHAQRLNRDHVRAVAAHGFDRVELAATRSHFDYHSPAATADLQQWLAESGLALQSVHAPVGERFIAGRWNGVLNLASADASERERALTEAERALYIARRIPFKTFVIHLGLPRTALSGATGSSREGARRSVEALHKAAAPLGVTLAIEVIQNELSRAASLTHFIDRVIDVTGVGICLDFGHAHLDGDLTDAVEVVSEHLVAIHVHDNRGRADDHLLPFAGTIDWPAALTAVQKVGYDGPVMLEVASHRPESAADTLKRARHARQQMERLFAVW